jgi:hypothetical protein
MEAGDDRRQPARQRPGSAAPSPALARITATAWPPNEKPGERAGRSEVWSRDEVRRLNIMCGLGVGSLCHTEATVRLRTSRRDGHASIEEWAASGGTTGGIAQRITSQGPEAKPLNSNARSRTMGVGFSPQARMRMKSVAALAMIWSEGRCGAVGCVST